MTEKLFFIVHKLFGRDLKGKLIDLQKTESLSTKQLSDLMWSRLKTMIQCAYDHTSFYREQFDSLSLKPNDIQTSEDLKRIPITDKSTLRKHFIKFINQDYKGRTTSYGSSGSTGEPVLLHQSTEALAGFFAAKLRGHIWHGLIPGIAEGKIWGTPLTGTTKLLTPLRNLLLNRIQLSAFHASEQTMLKAFHKMKTHHIQYLYGYASSIYMFSQFLRSKSIDPNILSPKAIITTSDMLLDDQKQFMESFWKCQVIKEYGAGETGIIAFECEKRNLHITQENVYLEILPNQKSGSNNQGEVIVTPLLNYAMPLLRYRLNDIAELKDGICECGRNLPLLKNIYGRSSDIVRTPDGRYIHSLALCYINRNLMKNGMEARYFQLIQETLDTFKLLVVPGKSKDIKSFADGVQEILGNATCHVEQVTDIPRTQSGKFQYVISRLQQEHTS